MTGHWRAARLMLATAGLGLVGCSSPTPVELSDIELPPDVERYRGAEEVPIDSLLSQVIETLPDDTDVDYEVLYPTGGPTDPIQWLTGAVSRAGFEPADEDLVAVDSRWRREGQTLTLAHIPFTNDDGSVTELLVLMLITRS